MSLSADHALQIAVQMEQLGYTFYEALAAGCGQAEISRLADSLAKAELTHLQTFKQMLSGLPAEQRGRKLTEEQLVSAVKEWRNAILPTASEVRQVVLRGDIVEVLDMAIAMETNAIAFYLELASSVIGKDATVVTSLAAEERQHLSMLQDQRRRYLSSSPKPARL